MENDIDPWESKTPVVPKDARVAKEDPGEILLGDDEMSEDETNEDE